MPGNTGERTALGLGRLILLLVVSFLSCVGLMTIVRALFDKARPGQAPQALQGKRPRSEGTAEGEKPKQVVGPLAQRGPSKATVADVPQVPADDKVAMTRRLAWEQAKRDREAREGRQLAERRRKESREAEGPRRREHAERQRAQEKEAWDSKVRALPVPRSVREAQGPVYDHLTRRLLNEGWGAVFENRETRNSADVSGLASYFRLSDRKRSDLHASLDAHLRWRLILWGIGEAHRYPLHKRNSLIAPVDRSQEAEIAAFIGHERLRQYERHVEKEEKEREARLANEARDREARQRAAEERAAHERRARERASAEATTDEVTREYSRNVIAADRTYKGSTIVVRSAVEEIGKELWGDRPYLVLRGAHSVRIYCRFDPEDPNLDQVKTNHIYTIRGVVERQDIQGRLVLGGCSFR